MSLPDEKVAGYAVPNLVYSLLIDKYLDEPSSTSLAISEVLDGFSPLYSMSRKSKGLVVNHKCSYFTPTSWNRFITDYISLESIKVLNVNNLYWLPADILVSTIVQMPILEELSIKSTQVCSVGQVAKILQACPEVVTLDFTYTEKTQEEIWAGLKKEKISVDSLVASFKKLTSLKLSTTVADYENNIFNDPWFLVIKLLTFCGRCTDLKIEITYPRKRVTSRLWTSPYQLHRVVLNREQEDAKEEVERDWFPKLEWMKSLESLVMIKLGQGDARVISCLLDALCDHLFPHLESNPTPRPLHCLWIQGFETYRVAAWKYVIPERLRSFRTGDGAAHDENFEPFTNLEHLGGSIGLPFHYFPLSSVPKLKYASGYTYEYNDVFYKFCESHPELEHVTVGFISWLSNAPNDAIFKLPKLRSFSCGRETISKEFVEGMVEGYPVLESLRLTTCHLKSSPNDDRALSTISFPHLTFLSLCGFDLKDGFALLSIIDKCPKLQSLHMETNSLESSSFTSNFKRFLSLARNLRDFRLKWNNHEDDEYPGFALLLLKSIREKGVHLEKLVIIDGSSKDTSFWSPPPDFANLLVELTTKLEHLTCCCITFNHLSVDLMKETKQRVEKEVVNERPSLWFHLDRRIPEASDFGVPWIHFHEIVHPMSFTIPRF